MIMWCIRWPTPTIQIYSTEGPAAIWAKYVIGEFDPMLEQYEEALEQWIESVVSHGDDYGFAGVVYVSNDEFFGM